MTMRRMGGKRGEIAVTMGTGGSGGLVRRFLPDQALFFKCNPNLQIHPNATNSTNATNG